MRCPTRRVLSTSGFACWTRVAWLWLASWVTASAAHVVQARPAHSLELEWSAPASCPNREAVLERLNQHLPDVPRSQATALRVRARIARVGHTFRLELEIESDGGVAKRSLSNAQCSALAEAAAVLVALAIEPQTPDANPLAEVPEDGPTAAETPASAATARAGQPAQRQDRQTSPPDGQPPTAERSAEGPRQRDSAPGPELGAVPTLDARDAGPATSTMQRLGLQLSASARGSLGLFPHAALGVQALLELHPAPFYAAVGVTYWPTGEQRSSSYPNASLRGAGLFADLSVGFTLTAGPLAVTPALCAELGGLRAEALGIDQPQPKRVLWAAAGASLLAAVSVLSHWTLGVEVAGLVPIFRTKWLVQSPTGDAPTYEASLVAPRVSLRLGYRFR